MRPTGRGACCCTRACLLDGVELPLVSAHCLDSQQQVFFFVCESVTICKRAL